jgi:methionine biosynthesis protein MetW
MPTDNLHRKRQTDFEILAEWIPAGARILDLGCGRGVLLEHLHRTRSASVLGVDNDLAKVQACIRRGLPIYQGDLLEAMDTFEGAHFDWVILSRTVQELHEPERVLQSARRVGREVAVGFLNYGYWRNRLHFLLKGERPLNDVFRKAWPQARADTPVSVGAFERYCAQNDIPVTRHVYLRGDWRTPCSRFPSLRAGYALYALKGCLPTT